MQLHDTRTRKLVRNSQAETRTGHILAAVPAAELTKTRWRLVIGGRQYTIDQFHGRLEGLHLVETTLEPDDPTVEAPEFTTVDVTHEDRYAGGSLATASDPDVTEILTRRGV